MKSNIMHFTKFYSNTLEYGLFFQDKNKYVKEHTHDYLEIAYQIAGFSTHIIDNKEIILNEGEFLILNTDQTHENPKTNSEVINILISPKFFSNLIIESSFDNNVVQLKDLLLNYTHKDKYLLSAYTEPLMMQLIHNHNNLSKFNYILQRTLLIQILLSIYSNTTFNIVMHSNKQSDIFMYIHNNLRTASLTEYADILCTSTSAASLRIKKYYNLSFIEILHDFRLTKSIDLLTNTDYNIERIIYEVGYENQSYFYKLFKGKYGMTPKKYRSVHCNKL